jgi:hypothetical protein
MNSHKFLVTGETGLTAAIASKSLEIAANDDAKP